MTRVIKWIWRTYKCIEIVHALLFSVIYMGIKYYVNADETFISSFMTNYILGVIMMGIQIGKT